MACTHPMQHQHNDKNSTKGPRPDRRTHHGDVGLGIGRGDHVLGVDEQPAARHAPGEEGCIGSWCGCCGIRSVRTSCVVCGATGECKRADKLHARTRKVPRRLLHVEARPVPQLVELLGLVQVHRRRHAVGDPLRGHHVALRVDDLRHVRLHLRAICVCVRHVREIARR